MYVYLALGRPEGIRGVCGTVERPAFDDQVRTGNVQDVERRQQKIFLYRNMVVMTLSCIFNKQ